MQLKLLNFYKIISRFASNIVGAFVALIIYQTTYSFTWAFVYLTGQHALRILFNFLLKERIEKKPQLMLLIRIIPFLTYSLCILLLDSEIKLLAIFMILIFHSLSDVLSELPTEFVYNYSALNGNSKSAGATRVYEYAGAISAMILGGIFLDNLPKWVVIVISAVTYLISIIPLFIFYLKQRNSTGFNRDATSNAKEQFDKIRFKKHQAKVISRKFLFNYFVIYFMYCVLDALPTVFNLYLFKMSAESYSLSSYIQVAFNAMFGLGSYITGILDDKFDLTILVSFSAVISGTLVCLLPYAITNIVLVIVMFAIIGYLYSHISIFCYSRMTLRAKVLGVTNASLYNRSQAAQWSQILIDGLCAFGAGLLIPSFFVMGITFGACAYCIPMNEEANRKMIVDYLQNNKMY